MNLKKLNTSAMLLLIVFCLCFLGLIMILSASSAIALERYNDSLFYLKKQIVWVFIGFISMFIVSSVNMEKLRKASFLVFVSFFVLLLMLFIPEISRSINGARRWLDFRIFIFQPSEFIKLAVILYISDILARKRDKGFLSVILICGLTTFLILIQPDLGTSILISVVALSMIYISGVKLIHIVLLFVFALPIVYYYTVHVGYRYQRLIAFINPWSVEKTSGFQVVQSLLAFGSGGVFGVGLSNSQQKLFYLPTPYTDFIYSIIGEELGFIGAVLVCFCFVLFVLVGFKIIVNNNDVYNKLVAFGITLLIGLEALVNMGVATSIFPTKGTTLPFVSYGGSSIVCKLIAVGILLNISRHCRKRMRRKIYI